MLAGCPSPGGGGTAPSSSLTLTTIGSGGIQVDGAPARSGTFTITARRNAVVTLAAIPTPGHRFVAWEGALLGTITPIDLTLNATNLNVTARFEPIPVTLTLAFAGDGAARVLSDPAGIDCGAPCSADFPIGSSVTLTAQSAPDNRILGWAGCDTVESDTCTVALPTPRTVTLTTTSAPPPPSNDDFADRVTLPSSATGDESGTTRGAGRESGEPTHGAAGGTVWYRFVAPFSGDATFTLTADAAPLTLIAYGGGSLSTLSELGRATAAAGGSGAVTIRVAGGGSTQIAIASTTATPSGFTLTWSLTALPTPATWQLDPDALTLTGNPDQGAPLTGTLTLRNVGDETGTFTIQGAPAWLTVTPTTGTLAAGAQVDLALTAAACGALGSDAATLTIAGGATPVAARIERLCRAVRWRFAPTTITLAGDVGEDDGATAAFALHNDGNQGATFTLTSDDDAIVLTPASGTIAPGASAAITASTDPCTLTLATDATLSAVGGGATATATVERLCQGGRWNTSLSDVALTSEVDGNPATATITLDNAGGDAADFTAGSNRAWLDTEPSDGTLAAGASATITIVADACTSVGTRTGRITIEGGLDEIDVDVTHTCTPATWTLTPSSLTFTSFVGDPAPAAQNALLTNLSAPAGAFTAASNSAWLQVTPTSGTVPTAAETPLAISTGTCQTLGTDTGEITVTTATRTDRVTVTRTCQRATWRTTPAELAFTVNLGGTAPDDQTLALRNDGNASADFTIVDDRDWLTVAPTSGTQGTSGSTTLTVSVGTCANVGTDTATITIGGGGHTTTVPVSRTCTTGAPPFAIDFDRVYLNQAVPAQDAAQNAADRIPLVIGRGGLLRAFVTADQSGAGSTVVKVHYRYANSGAYASITLTGPSTVPTTTNEATLSTTYRTVVDEDFVAPGLRWHFTLDTTIGGIPYTVRHPANGDVTPAKVSVPDADFRLVPITYGGVTPNVGNGSAYVDFTERVFPLDDVSVAVRGAYVFNGTLTSGGAGWGQLLEDLTALRLLDGSPLHYVGLVDPGYDSGVAGVAWQNTTDYTSPFDQNYMVALSWSYLPSANEVVAHEIGHNWSLPHAPCGGPDGVDPDYPYDDAQLGTWGFDLANETLVNPTTYRDLMSYCDPQWISDYNYANTLAYRSPTTVAAAPEPRVRERVLIVSGSVDEASGAVTLAPLQILTSYAAAPAPGPFTLRGFDDAGVEILNVAFETIETSLHLSESFVFAVPAPLAPLARVQVERDGVTLLERGRPLAPASVSATRATETADGRVLLTWDANAYPEALVRDGIDGALLTRGRGGEVLLAPSSRTLEVFLSDGIATTREVIAW